MPLLSWLDRTTDERPDAVRVDDRATSWVELRRAAAAVAVALRAAMDRELRAVGLSVPQYACLRLLAHGTG
ncbi:hypothetical protein, partial [Micromonospora maritima]|uniref:hypothetical protein n=1 Tax=Micromonospora maritima TaxID=986711 RepID=UPI00157D55B8